MDAKEAAKKVQEINEVVSELAPEVRAAAFELLVPYYFERAEGKAKREKSKDGEPPAGDVSDSDEAAFFGRFNHDRPADNVDLIAAWLYSQHGVHPITTKDLKTLANRVGLTVPARPDATMRVARQGGKKLYQKHGEGYALTVHGEAHVKSTYEVRKGRRPWPVEEDGE